MALQTRIYPIVSLAYYFNELIFFFKEIERRGYGYRIKNKLSIFVDRKRFDFNLEKNFLWKNLLIFVIVKTE